MKQNFRPIIAIGLAYTLCVLAIIHAAGIATPPQWFLAMAIPIIVGLMSERAYRKNKGE